MEKEVEKALARSDGETQVERQLHQELRKLQNLIAAVEGGASAPSALLKAIAEREANIERLEAQVRRDEQKPAAKVPDLPQWVREQLLDLIGLLKTDPARVKSEFRRPNLQLSFNPIEAEPRPYYVVNGQCDLSALAYFYLRSRYAGAVLDRTREHSEQ